MKSDDVLAGLWLCVVLVAIVVAALLMIKGE